MRTIIAVALAVALTFGAAVAQVATPDMQGNVQATSKVAVHTKVRPEVMNRPLTHDEKRDKEKYMGMWCKGMDGENRKCIEDALDLYFRLGIFHNPADFGREPRVLFAMYQQDTEWRNPLKVDVWADVPVCRPYTPPPFVSACPATPITPLALADVSVPCTETLSFTATQLYKVGVEQAKALELTNISVPCTETLSFTATQLYKVGVEQAKALELAEVKVPCAEGLAFTSTQLYKVGVEQQEPLKLRSVKVPPLPRVSRCKPEAERPHGGCAAPTREERGAMRVSEPGSEIREPIGGATFSQSEVRRSEEKEPPDDGTCGPKPPGGGAQEPDEQGVTGGDDASGDTPQVVPDPTPGTDSPGGGGQAIPNPNGDGVPAPPIDGTGPEPLSPDGGDIVTVL